MNQISVSIPVAQSEYSRMGLKSTVFIVHIHDNGQESSVILDDLDFQYLHEQLSRLPNVHVPIFPKRSFSLFESTASVEARRLEYERFLESVLSSPDCVASRVLWVTLGLSPESSIVPRFLLLGDNLSEVDELSSHATQLHRLCNVSTLLSLQRCLPESVSVLFRILSDSASHRVVNESGLIRALIESPHPTVTPLLLFLVESNPNSLFVYLQRDMSGLVEAVDSSLDLAPIAHALLAGAQVSSDIELTLTDKPSMGLLNKLLVRGRDTETEILVAFLLCYLQKKNLINETYNARIASIVDSITEREVVFPDEVGVSLLLLSSQNSGIKLASYWYAKKGTDVPTSRLQQLLKTELDESTKTWIAQAIIMGGTFVKDERINSLVLAKLGTEMTKINNFLIEVNFEISNKGVGELANVAQVAAEMHALFAKVGRGADLAMRMDARVHATHSDAMDTILRSMLEVKAHLAEIERIRRETNQTDHKELQERMKTLCAASAAQRQLVGGLAATTASIDETLEKRNFELREVKGVLLKIQTGISQFVDLIDGDQGTGDYITPDD